MQLTHDLPSIRFRQVEKLHRTVYLHEPIDIHTLKKDFAIHVKDFTHKELKLLGQVFLKLYEDYTTDFSDIVDQLDYLYTQTSIDIPRNRHSKAPLIFYEEEQELSLNEVECEYPNNFKNADDIFAFAIDHFYKLKPCMQLNQFLMNVFTTDYYEPIIELYLLYHPLNLVLLKPYLLYVNDSYTIYKYLCQLDPKTYVQALKIIFPLVKHINTTELYIAIINSLVIVDEFILNQSLAQFDFFKNMVHFALIHDMDTILLYLLSHGTLKHFSYIYSQLQANTIYSADFIIIASYFNQKEYLDQAKTHPIAVGPIIYYNLSIPPLFAPLFLFKRVPIYSTNANPHLLSQSELKEFHVLYRNFCQFPTDNHYLTLYHQLINQQQCQVAPQLLDELSTNTTSVVAKKLFMCVVDQFTFI